MKRIIRSGVAVVALAAASLLGVGTASAAYNGPCANALQDATITPGHAATGYAATHRLDSFTLNAPIVIDDQGDTFTLASATAKAHRRVVDSYITFGDAGIDVEHDTWSTGNWQVGVVSGPGAIAKITLCVELGNPTS